MIVALDGKWETKMVLDKQQTKNLYRKRAKNYDSAMWLYRLTGFRVNQYRQDAVEALSLDKGDTVVELGCGTGLNFPYLQKAIGEAGRIVGVDLTDAMLEQAHQRVVMSGWRNVELIQADLSRYAIPKNVKGVLSSLAITLVPEYDEIIQRGAKALQPGGRLAILDFKEPETWPAWLISFAAWLNKPYGVSLELANRRPMESVRRYLKEVKYREYYYGVLYLSVGESEDG
jgi:demethylmenaquinone methyltransferase/2-methoxy-6-polyprenyl-1,4-benzoquinol methylase